MKQAYFITGTDTGVGKTLISSALVYRFASQGLKALGMKPVSAGCELDPLTGQLLSEDVASLIAASNVDAPLNLINPYAFAPAIAPHIAAAQSGVMISLDEITEAFQQLTNLADVVIVEGVGGFCVPLNTELDTADLAQQLNLPVIMVVGMRLGCINHALLTMQAIKGRGLSLVGWVANQVDPHMTAYAENLDALHQRIPAPCLGVLPWLERADVKQAVTFLKLPD
ncbi:MAG TPA: dethiobiotin synthase [Methylophilaceae bacterium]|nr:dethiobiotin synthase [Methylophilaceae bacterium]